MNSTEFVNCKGLPPGSLLDVETKNRHYLIECLGGSAIRISGHPEYCPTPVPGRMLEPGLIELGKHLEFLLDGDHPVATSRITHVRVQTPPSVH